MKLTIGKKLGLAFGTILTLMLVNAVVTHLSVNMIARTQESMAQLRVPTVEALKDLQRDLNQTQSMGRQAVLSGTQPARRDAAKVLFDSAWNDIEKDIAGLNQLAPHLSIQ